jgi:large repetitive protein
MTVTAEDFGVLGNLATAIGLLDADGDPNPGWLGDPAESLSTMLADESQREALIGFVDEAMGGADRETDPSGATWLPLIALEDPDLTVAITIDDSPADHVTIGIGVKFTTANPASRSSASVPLFKAAKLGKSVATPFVLGQPGGRLRFDTRITVDADAPVPGQARVGAVGLEFDVATSPSDPVDAFFGLVLEDFQLPGVSAPQTLRVSAAGADELDNAVLDLVLSLVRAQAEAAGGSALGALAGLLGLGPDAVDDFPIEQLATQGPRALGTWLEGILASAAARQAWLDHLATLVGGTRAGDEIALSLGGVNAALRLGLRTDSGPSGHIRLTATLGADVGATSPRVQARLDAFQIDLGTGEALALPALGLWASIGRHDGSGARVLDVSSPTIARADRLRLGFGLDPARRLTFVLAADTVLLGTREYETLDLTSPDAVMDAAGNAVEDVANELLGELGAAIDGVKLLLGIDPPPGHPTVPTVSLAKLLGDPVAAVSGYWRTLLSAHGDAVPTLLEVVRDAIADAGAAIRPIRGTGSAGDPWRIPLVGPVELEGHMDGDTLTVALAAGTRVDTLGQRCTVIETRLAATVAVIDLAGASAQLLPSVEGRLTARERGVSPSRAALELGDGAVLIADHVGIRLSWAADSGLSAHFDAPSLHLQLDGETIPIALPIVADDGSVTLPADDWDALQALVGHLTGLLPGFPADVAALLGWRGNGLDTPALRLADLVDDPGAAFAAWLPELLMSELGPTAVGALADLLSAAGPVSGAIAGSGHPDDPYRLALDLAPGVPELVVWFPPEGLEPRLVAAPQSLQRWRPGDPGLPPDALAAAILLEAGVSVEIRDLATGRNIASGLADLITRWSATDGRIVPPATPPAGVDVDRIRVAAGQLLGRLDLEDQLGRLPTTVVYVAIGDASWPGAPADRRVDLTAPGLTPDMFAAPTAAAGDWFVALGERAACRLASGDDDGTVGQAARLGRVLDALAPLGTDLVLVGLGGAGHAARLAAQEQPAFSDVVTLGTPLGPVSLTALATQPTADALRLLQRLLPAPNADAPDDEDLSLGRNLVAAMMELVDRADPTVELRPPATALPTPRAGLTTTAIFGDVEGDQVGRAITAIVAAGLATRARARALTPLPEATGVRAGVRFAVSSTTAGSLAIEGDALVTLAGYDRAGGITTARELRLRLTMRDRLGWLVATPEVALRMLTADVIVPLGGGAGPGQTRIGLHDARALGVDRERLVLGTAAEAVPLLPEARVLLGTAVERLVADAANPAAAGLAELLTQLGLVSAGGAVPTAFEQLIHDPAGLMNDRLAAAGPAIADSIGELLGAAGAAVDLAERTITISAGGPSSGKFGWNGRLSAEPGGLTGQITLGPPGPFGAAGGLQLALELAPFAAELRWHRPSGVVDEIPLWPDPDPADIARALAQSAPSLGAHISLELMRRADEDARPVIEAVLDALGVLGGAPGDENRPLRPLAGLIADPAGWLRSAESIGSQPAKAQALFDALRPLTGLSGSAGDPLPLADGVSLSIQAAGPDLRLEFEVDGADWAAVATPFGRLAGGLSTALTIPATGPPTAGLALHVGLDGAPPGRQAVHVALGPTGIAVFVRPSAGADLSLIPFAGLGVLADAAKRALPFLLDELAGVSGPVGAAVAGVGDALALRTGSPKAFDGDELAAWAADPVAALADAVPSIVSTGLTTLAPLLDAVVPGNVAVTATATELAVGAGAVSVRWNPTAARVTVAGDGIDVPGIEELSFTVALSDSGLDELTVTVGPAAIDAGVTLQPFVTVAAGSTPAGGRRVAVGLALDDTHRFGARWLLDSGAFSLIASNGPIATPSDVTDAVEVALRAVEAVADLVAAVALGTQAVQDLLDTPVGADQVRDLLRGVLLEDTADPAEVIGGLFDPSTALDRVQRLFENVAGATLSVTVEGLTISLLDDAGTIGVQLGLAQKMQLLSGDVDLWLETDDSWIENNPPGSGGLFVGLLSTGGTLVFEPSLTVNGVGLRIAKTSGPLLDFGFTLEAIAFHTFARLDLAGAKAGGLQLALSNLAISASGASGDNSIARGLLKDTGSQPPKPAFSPALAIQKHGNEPIHVTLRAGPGDGPWWILIQKGFGPLYLEQVGLGVTMPQRRVERISLLMDGSVSLFGLTCEVDDLQITYLVSRGDFFNAANWEVDLAGLAVTADMAGLTVSGGLLKSGQPPTVEYLGMLLARFGVYGITIYGGYGEGKAGDERFVAFFAVGAINGPIGGPPAFFLTGIGGGFGINRALVVPTDLSQFGEYPLIQALDIAAAPANPMDQLRSLGAYFPMERGTFWFAAGLSFNSFALVDGIAVVAVEVGDGLDISLLGQARMALPRPQVAIVSIELALLARFSSSEGVLWVQGQLTDNSWLLYPDVRLTGGFAFVTWFKGEYRGQFVLTIGGYHPDFNKPGYPLVPRLGLRWGIGDNIVIKAGGYFALTSEAVMAGGDFEASAEFGPAWAEVRFGAHGIVYFDPFRYKVGVYARISAGVTIDLWILGEVTISVSLGANIEVEGPDFHGKATFEVGPIEITVEFGSREQTRKELLAAGPFIDKYLEAGPAGGARAVTVITSSGAQPFGGAIPTPDGAADRPYVVVCEFSLVLTSTVPATDVVLKRPSGNDAPTRFTPTRQLGVAPMGTSSVSPAIELAWFRTGAQQNFPFVVTGRRFGAFPIGVWGPPQDDNNRKTPQGEIVEALNELDLVARATESPGGPEIPYHQVEIGDRKPLPFTRRAVDETRIRDSGIALADLVPEPSTVEAAFATAGRWLADSTSPTGLATLRGERQAPPRFGTLGEGLDALAASEIPGIGEKPPQKEVDRFVHPPVAVGVLSAAGLTDSAQAPRGTTVEGSSRLLRTPPPTMAAVEASRSPAIAPQLVLLDADAERSSKTRTVVAAGEVPTTAVAREAPAAVGIHGGDGRDRLRALTGSLTAARRIKAAIGTPGAQLAAGEIAVLRLPNAIRDVSSAGDPLEAGESERPRLGARGESPVRLVALANGGEVIADLDLGGPAAREAAWTVVEGTERLAVIALGLGAERESGLAGWHAAMQLPYVGWSTALGARCTVRSFGGSIPQHRERADAGWVAGAELTEGLSTVSTRFALEVTSVLLVLDDPEALGGSVDGRRLALGLDGATRATDPAGEERPPVVLSAENRTVLAYDVVPTPDPRPVAVTVATEHGWSLAGVLGASGASADSAIGSIAAGGLDASLRPIVPGQGGSVRLRWLGEKPPKTTRPRKRER